MSLSDPFRSELGDGKPRRRQVAAPPALRAASGDARSIGPEKRADARPMKHDDLPAASPAHNLSTVCKKHDQEASLETCSAAREEVMAVFGALSLSDHVRNLLLKQMTSGHLKPGGRINEAKLARTLGISRNPIREAISGLAQRGYLVSLPRRGHRMRVMTAQDIDDVFSFRISLESFAIELALPRMAQRDLAAIRAIYDRMSEAAKRDNVTEVREADLALHRTICELSGNRQLLRAHEAIDTEIQILLASVDLEFEPLSATAAAHLPIVEALESRDVARLLAAMRHHLQATWNGVTGMYRRAGLFDPDDDQQHVKRPHHVRTLEESR